MLTCRKHVETTALKRKKGLSVLKAMAAKGIEQRHLFLPYQSVVLSVTDYGLGLTTKAQTNLLKLDRVQKGRQRAIVSQTNIGTVSKATLWKLLRDRVERMWAFPSAKRKKKKKGACQADGPVKKLESLSLIKTACSQCCLKDFVC